MVQGTVEQTAGAVTGSAAAAWVGDFVLQLIGVPLPVVLASAAGAGLARSFLEPVGFVLALGYAALWTILGCAGAPLAQALFPAVAQAVFNRELALPANTLAAMAALISSAPYWWPRVWPLIAARFAQKPKGE